MNTIHVPAGEGQHYRMIDGDYVDKATVESSDGGFEVFEIVAEAAPMAPPHVSPWSGLLYLLEGRLRVVVDDATYDVGPGDVLASPAGTPMTFEVVGDAARFLAITTGDRAGRFFADFAGSVSPDQPVERSLEAILEVTRRHGVAVAGG